MADPFVRKAIILSLALLLFAGGLYFFPLIEQTLIGLTAAPRVVAARGELAADEKSTIDIFEQSSPSVVYITTLKRVLNPWTRNVLSIPKGAGSGFVWDGLGHIVTNHHVISDASEAQIRLSDGRTYRASLVGSSPDHDLAVLRIRVPIDRPPPVPVGTSDDLRVGQKVYAIGNPFGVGQTVTMGIVGATGRSHLGINTFEDFIQTDAAINPGNSGGALINAAGELVGINTAIFSKSGGSHGIGFAIPIDLAKDVMIQILKQGRVIRGWLGVSGQDITPEIATSLGFKPVHGILVSGVQEHGPADNAGVNPGDIITRIDGEEATNAYEAMNRIARLTPGTRVHLEGWRGQQPFAAQAVTAERPLETD